MAILSPDEQQNALILANAIELGTNILMRVKSTTLTTHIYESQVTHGVVASLLAEGIANNLRSKG